MTFKKKNSRFFHSVSQILSPHIWVFYPLPIGQDASERDLHLQVGLPGALPLHGIPCAWALVSGGESVALAHS